MPEIEYLSLLVIGGFTISSFFLSLSTLIGVPGGWLILALAIGLEYFDQTWGLPAESFGWTVIGIGFALLVLGEIIEFFVGALAAKYGGASKKGAWFSLLGSIVGAFLGTFLVPIPLFGSLIGSMMGAFGFAYWIEKKDIDTSDAEALKSASYAAVGRALGACGKLGVTGITSVLLVMYLAKNYVDLSGL